MDQDTRLINETLAGNAAAFGQLVRSYQDRLFSTLVYLTGSADEAEDIAQDTFVQAYVKLASFQARSGFYTWIYRIACNLWISQRRRQRATQSVDELRDRLGHEPADPLDAPPSQLERQERVQLIRTALGQLNEEYRTIIVLRELDGCDYETIAEMLELPLGTVRSRLHRARLELKRHLELVLREPS